MKCLSCGSKSTVIFTKSPVRYRKCLKCRNKWETVEILTKRLALGDGTATKPPDPATHPVLVFIHEERHRQKISGLELARMSAITHWTLSRWKQGHTHPLRDVEMVLNTLGYELVVQKRG